MDDKILAALQQLAERQTAALETLSAIAARLDVKVQGLAARTQALEQRATVNDTRDAGTAAAFEKLATHVETLSANVLLLGRAPRTAQLNRTMREAAMAELERQKRGV